MNPYIAVFNCHVNDALEETIEVFKDIYGTTRYDLYIKKYVDNGIMSIFSYPQNKYTKFFVYHIHRVVNS